MKKVMLLLMLAGWCAYGYAGKGPTASLYKIMRDGQRRDTTVLHLQKMKDGGYMLRVPQKELEEMEFLQVVPRMAVGHQGEKGWFIDNNSLQVRYDVQHKQKPYQIQWEEKYLVSDDLKDVTDGIQSTMGWDAGSLCISGYHEAKTKKTWLAVKEGMKFECRQLAKLKDGEYSLIDAYYLRDIKPYEDLTIFYYPVKGDTYTDIALRYRSTLR